MIDMAPQGILAPPGEHAAVAKIIDRRLPIHPFTGAPARSDHQGIEATQTRIIGSRNQPCKSRWVENRIQQHHGIEQTGIVGSGEQGQDAAETVPTANHSAIAPDTATMMDHLRHAFRTQVPSRETESVVAVAMALGVVQTQVVPLQQGLQQWPIGQSAQPIAMDEMDEIGPSAQKLPPTQIQLRAHWIGPHRARNQPGYAGGSFFHEGPRRV
jgi:hypothetical protein